MDKFFKNNINLIALLGVGGYLIYKKKLVNKDEQIKYVAKTLYGEGRGEGREGMQAIANVIYNRWRNSPTASFKDIVLKPYQFSCWLDNDANRKIIDAVDEKNTMYLVAKEIAKLAVNGQLRDITGGANHYANLSLANPYWADDVKKTVKIGNHTFFKL